jgi:hypothetical protein
VRGSEAGPSTVAISTARFLPRALCPFEFGFNFVHA